MRGAELLASMQLDHILLLAYGKDKIQCQSLGLGRFLEMQVASLSPESTL